ncbi:MAG: ABC transporter ATP-binding protein [Acidimicrobiales bacterium]
MSLSGKPGVWSSWHPARPFLAPSRRRLIAVAVTSGLGGLAEAVVLVLVVSAAVAMGAGSTTATPTLGPVASLDLEVPDLLGLALVLAMAMAALRTAAAHLAARLGADTLAATRKATFRSFIRASWAVQSQQEHGRLQDLLTTHLVHVAMAVQYFALGATALCNFAALFVAALVVDLPAAVGIVAVVGVLFVVLRPVSTRGRRAAAAHAAANLDYVQAVAESVAVVREVTAFNVGGAVQARVDRAVDDVSAPYFRMRRLAALVAPLYQNAAIVFLVAVIAGLYALGSTRLGSLGAVVLMLLRALSYSQTMQLAVHNFSEVAPYLDQVQDDRRRYEAAARKGGSQPLPELRRISFEDVWFAYDGARPVIRGVSFDVGRGEAIGIVGPSGGGKSTLLALLVRMLEPDRGRVLVNGTDAAEISLDDWHARVALVPQDPRLLQASVAENIAFFRPVSRAAVEHAAEMAHLHDEITGWPGGYDAQVGVGGGGLSGGQRQRLAIARALVGAPDLVVLDEPTSALDVHSESRVQRALEERAGTTTLFIVAHRLSTLSICDRIMVLQDGALQAFGRPDELLGTNAFYREAVELSGLRP